MKSPLLKWSTWYETGLLKRLLITVGLLAFYRLGVQVPLSGIDQEAFSSTMLSSNLLGFIDMFSGGALSALSVFALGIGPFITASIIFQLLTEAYPALKEMQREQGEEGRQRYQQWTRRASVLIAGLQGFALLRIIAAQPGVLTEPVGLFYAKALVSLMAGATFVMWLGEQISQFGIGNGGSLLIFAGIAARLPQMLGSTIEAWEKGITPTWGLVVVLGFFALVVVGIIYLQDGARRLTIVSARQAQVGGVMQKQGMQGHFLPIKVNPAGVLPIIFATAAMFLPIQILRLAGSDSTSIADALGSMLTKVPLFADWAASEVLGPVFEFIGYELDRFLVYQVSWEHSLLLGIAVVGFTFFYASIVLNPQEVAENLQKSGNAIQGVKPGKPTAEYIGFVLNRVSFIGAVGLALITVLPIHVQSFARVETLAGLGGTALIIMVGVTLDLYNQIYAYVEAHKYQVRSLLNRSANPRRGGVL